MKYRYLLYAVLVWWGATSLTRFCMKQTGQLQLSLIRSTRPYDPLFDTRPLTADEEKEKNEALGQTYTYFGCGGQAYVFFSEDGKYVIKFFKQHHFNPPTHLNYIPGISKYRERKFAKRRLNLEQDYLSYKMGFEELPHETELVYLHLNPTSHIKKELTLIDRLNIVHKIDLDTTDFLIQRRAEAVLPTLKTKLKAGDQEGAKETINQLLSLVMTRCKKGFGDADPNLITNCGIYKDHAIKIDIGRFSRSPHMHEPLFYKPELYRITRPFRKWLVHNAPELVEHLDSSILEVINDTNS
ncbi:MAG: hypothetical protein JSR58_07940 [Verrucomicrobia bacterium]|nr:hypothetical protein [Verrucomicrobiota bacterium]